MQKDSELELHIQKNDKAIQELNIRIENLDSHVNELFYELKVTPEQLTNLIENETNFTEENWQELLRQKEEIQQKLNRDLGSICNPLVTKNTYAKRRRIPNHWLFVR